MKSCVIIIPIYKDTLNEYETISLKRCLTVFRGYDIRLLTYAELTTPSIDKLLKKANVMPQRDFFDKRYFDGVSGYNELMMKAEFYGRYRDSYEYMLIYQLDCYVFENSLSHFLDLGLDYCGAPLPDEFNEDISKKYKDCFHENLKIHFFMNGGLSLRKIDAFLALCQNIDQRWSGWNEDLFFSIMVPRPADRSIALQFAFECYPKECYEENNHTLPMGCHAWYKCGGGNTGLYNDLFWYRRISKLIYARKKIRRFVFR